jgi:hypothetical protein
MPTALWNHTSSVSWQCFIQEHHSIHHGLSIRIVYVLLRIFFQWVEYGTKKIGSLYRQWASSSFKDDSQLSRTQHADETPISTAFSAERSVGLLPIRKNKKLRNGAINSRWDWSPWDCDPNFGWHFGWRIARHLLQFDWMCPKHHWCKWRLYVRVNIPIKMIILHASFSINGWVTDWTPYTEHCPSGTLHNRGIKSRWPISK